MAVWALEFFVSIDVAQLKFCKMNMSKSTIFDLVIGAQVHFGRVEVEKSRKIRKTFNCLNLVINTQNTFPDDF